VALAVSGLSGIADMYHRNVLYTSSTGSNPRVDGLKSVRAWEPNPNKQHPPDPYVLTIHLLHFCCCVIRRFIAFRFPFSSLLMLSLLSFLVSFRFVFFSPILLARNFWICFSLLISWTLYSYFSLVDSTMAPQRRRTLSWIQSRCQ
jgi:hypothetical protein